MKYNANELWNSFINSFKKNLKEFNNDRPLSKTLIDKTKTTSFYKKELFPKIASDHELELSEKEFIPAIT